jgi:hypothetical protein
MIVPGNAQTFGESEANALSKMAKLKRNNIYIAQMHEDIHGETDLPGC